MMSEDNVIDLNEKRKAKAMKAAADTNDEPVSDIRDKLVAKMNDTFATVSMSGKVAFMEESPSKIKSRRGALELHFSKNADMENRFSNDLHLVGDKWKSSFTIWMESKKRREYWSIVMDPALPPGGNDKEKTYNMWRGWPWSKKLAKDRAHKPEKWKRIRHHIQHVICNDNAQLARWLYAWMAERFKHPEKMAGVCLVLMGEEGAGKGTFVTHILGGCYDPTHFIAVSDSKRLFGDFNRHMANTLLVFADEAFFAGNHDHIGRFKTMITEPTFMMEPKGVDAFPVANYRAFVVASNSARVIAAGDHSRRYTVFNVNEDYLNNRAYFDEILQELANGGREEMLRYLLQEDFSDVDPYVYFPTEGLQEQRELNRDDGHQYVFDLLDEGVLPRVCDAFGGESPGEAWPLDAEPQEIPRSRIQSDYLARGYMKRAYKQEVQSAATVIGRALKKYLPSVKSVRRFDPNLKRQIFQYQFPSLKQAREDYNAKMETTYWREKVEPPKPRKKPARKK